MQVAEHWSLQGCTMLTRLAAASLAVWVAVALLRRILRVLAYLRINLPSPPETSLLLGHAVPMMSESQPVVVAEWVAQCGPLFKLRIMDKHMYMLADPTAITQLNR